jgi:hypothetical protein
MLCLYLWLLTSVMWGCKPSSDARNLPLEGIQSHVCGHRPFDPGSNTCGERSVWLEADTGMVAYVTIYGVGSREEALDEIQYLKDEKRRLRHGIAIVASVFSTPREMGREPKSSLLVEERF